VQNLRSHLGLRPDAQHVDPVQGNGQVVFVQRSPPGVHS
jgi:hypothetical protein